MDMLFTVLGVCAAYCCVSVARTFWHMGTFMLYVRLSESRQAEIARLEREIVLEQFRCAASNPQAANILMAKERARKLSPAHRDYKVYRRLFAFELGGEPINESPTQKEQPPCDTAAPC